jgi:predicted helicase
LIGGGGTGSEGGEGDSFLSRQLINEYRADLDRLRQVSGSRRESVLREAFKDLLKRWGKSLDLQFIPEHDIVTPKGNRIYVDGALLHGLRVPFGYWEAKDADDKLDDEITDKFRKGYPKDNIIFSDDVTAVLYQDGHEQMRAAMDDAETLLPLLSRFFAHERQEIADFKKAVKQFALDLPAVLTALREIIQTKRAASRDFARAQDDFLKHARDAINPAVSEDDVQEMLIQHILTEDIFAKVFENPDFHRQNNVAAALYALEDKLFGYGEKQRLLKALGPYYAGIQSTAAMIESHTEKQGFLKGLYENFYKVYNPMAADRLGVVYTPGEIVRFMIKSADWLCETHFGKNLIDKGVEILDPATGTGTFIVELLEHFRGNHDKLRHKYKEELHANEVAILPYYVANLNIEATYAAITGQFAEYPNLCFVDTLDNVAALGIYAGHQGDMFGSVSDENMARVKRQNERKISVIIGNPPYNANQQNENDNNKNRAYARIDERIKQTYIKASTAQKTKLYDMYVRFLRWASDRLGDEGIVAFITNRSFIDARTADGFRRVVGKEFAEGWIVDLGGDYKKKGVGGTGNVFDIGTGVAINFWIKRAGHTGKIKLSYVAAPSGNGEDKRSWIAERSMNEKDWQTLPQREDGAWIDLPDEDGFAAFLPLGSGLIDHNQ